MTSADAQAVVSLKLKPTAQACAAGRSGKEGVACRAEVPFWTHPGKIPTCLFVSMKLPRRLKRKMQFIGKNTSTHLFFSRRCGVTHPRVARMSSDADFCSWRGRLLKRRFAGNHRERVSSWFTALFFGRSRCVSASGQLTTSPFCERRVLDAPVNM